MSEADFLDKELFKRVLLDPVCSGADTLRIVSGYASAAMASEHILKVRDDLKRSINVELIYGMAGADGITRINHVGFLSLQDKREFDYDGSFSCAYVRKPMAIHTKVYVWSKAGKPLVAFAGSANYTMNGFQGGDKRGELLVACDCVRAQALFSEVAGLTVSCQEADLRKEFAVRTPRNAPEPTSTILIETDAKSPFCGCAKVELPLITKRGDCGNGACLNWGVCADGTPRDDGYALREPNQAYIRLEAKIYRTDFFPPVKQRFTVLTDDGQIFSCTRAQQNGKAIHTPHDNSELGRYFRMRLGLQEGAYITPKDLIRYGRTSVTFYKLDDENYIMDFSSSKRK